MQSGLYRKRGSPAIQSLIGFTDQGIVALSSVLAILILGRLSASHELAIFSLSMSVGLMFTRAIAALTLASYPVLRARDPSASDVYTFFVLLYAVVAQCVFILAYLLIQYWCSDTETQGSVCSAIALIPYLPPIIFRHVLRYLSLYRGDLLITFLLDFMLFIAQTTGLLLVAELGVASAQKVYYVLVTTSVLFVVVWFWCYRKEIRVQLAGVVLHLGQCIAFGRWALISDLLGAMPYYVFPWLLVYLHGSNETAVYAAANTIVGIVSHASAGLTKSLPARMADAFIQGGIDALDKSLRQTCRFVLSIIAAIVALVCLAALPLSALFFPNGADQVATVVRILSLAAMVGSLHMIIGNGLWATARPQSTFVGDLVRGISAIGLGAFLGVYGGGKGCAEGLLFGNITGAFVLFLKYNALHSKSRVS